MNYQKMSLTAGLYFVGVPIGTARDITLRALDVLASADVLAAEDTRSLRRLLDIHGIALAGRRLVSLHDHSAEAARTALVRSVSAGQSVAYAAEAGMPLIADPGFELARDMVKAALPVTCAPGPSALTTALALGGLPTDAFFFAGFLPGASRARRSALEELRAVPGTLILYEAPKRIAAMLEDAALSLGATRAAAICREMTKRFEEVRRGTLADLASYAAAEPLKGEIVVLIDRDRLPTVNQIDISSILSEMMGDMSMRDAVDAVSAAHDLPRREVYQAALALKRGDNA
ncbi:MAG: 16S rRNA (cytidine(1402)-2'-O)-methyltransferase [Pseudomonadota bacterium]